MAASERMQALGTRIDGFLERMGLGSEANPSGARMFSYGTTAVLVSTFEEEAGGAKHTFVRFTATVLSGVDATIALLTEMLRLNAEVLLGKLLLFDDGSLVFAVTLMADKLDYEEFAFGLEYAARIADQLDDGLQVIAGGRRPLDLLHGEE